MPAIPLDRRTLLAALAGAFTTAAARAQGPASDRWADYVNARFGTGLIIVEQNVPATLKLVERALILKSGSVVYEGTAADLSAHQDLWKWF